MYSVHTVVCVYLQGYAATIAMRHIWIQNLKEIQKSPTLVVGSCMVYQLLFQISLNTPDIITSNKTLDKRLLSCTTYPQKLK